MMRYAANILVYLSLSVWIGGTIIFGAVVAPALFGGTIPRTLAGAINTLILDRLGMIQIVAGVVLIGGTLYGAIRVGSWMNWSALVLSIAMLAAATYTTVVLFPSVNRLRVEIGSFEAIPAEKAPLKAEFDRGHQTYSALAKATLGAAVLVLLLQTSALVRYGARRERLTAVARSAEVIDGRAQPDAIERTRPSVAR
jgi:hypothetical protein